jgi:signal transduction histidine kinase
MTTTQLEAKLERQLNFQYIVSQIGREFIRTGDVSKGLDNALENIGRCSNASRAYVFQFDIDNGTMDNTYEWCNDGVESEINNLKNLPIDMFPWWVNSISDGSVLNIHDVSLLGPEASAEKEILEMQGIKSVLVLPLIIDDELKGFAGFDNVETTGIWTEDDEHILSIAAEMFSNVFQRIEKETALADTNRELELALEKVRKTQIKLIQQEQMAAIGQLSAGVAHEINNPLGYVMSNHDILVNYINEIMEMIESNKNCTMKDKKKAEFEFIKTDINEIVEDIEDGLKRVEKIVKSLRTFSRIDKESDMDYYDIREGIYSTLTILNSRLKLLDKVEVDIPSSIPKIWMDAGKINQVILNAIVNAIDAISEMGKDHEGILKISIKTSDEFMKMEIEDNGIGMTEDVRKNIFTPFFTTKEVGKGTGLGMSIAYDIVTKLHKGTINIESEQGSGSSFIMTLPIRKSEDEG